MTKCISFILLVININMGFSQSDSTSSNTIEGLYGIRTGTYLNNYSGDFTYFNYFTYGKGIHEFSFGPSFGTDPVFLAANYLITKPKRIKLNGIDVAYRIYPNGKGKVFDFYFQLNYFQKWGKGSSKYVTFYEWAEENNQPNKITIRSLASILTLEQGFDIKFFNHFYFGLSIGFGGILDFRSFHNETNGEFLYKQVLDSDFVSRASFGVRF